MLQYDQSDFDNCCHKDRWYCCNGIRKIRSGSILLSFAVLSATTTLTLMIARSSNDLTTNTLKRPLRYKLELSPSNSVSENSNDRTTRKQRRILDNIFEWSRKVKNGRNDLTDDQELSLYHKAATLFSKKKKKKTKECTTYSNAPALTGKKGVAFTLRDEGQPGSWVQNLPKVTRLRPYWNYSWGPKRIAKQPNDIEFIPMLWGGNDVNTMKDAIKTHIVPQIKAGNVKHVLGFNEPDNKNQSNMEVSIALDRWDELESLNVPLVSPSCAHPGQVWMTSFMDDVNTTCRRSDWVGVHWYGSDFVSFKNAMTKYHDLYERPILVTEFALADWSATSVSQNKISKSDTLKFMKKAVYWLETQSWIVGYAWFSFERTHPAGTNSALFNDSGSWTKLGKFYASVRTNRPRGDRNIV